MQAKLLELAKQGDPSAIATLMNQALNTQGVSIQVAFRKGCLHILMESQQYLEPTVIVPALRKAMQDLQSPVIGKVRIYGHQLTENSSLWGQVIHLREDLPLPLTLRGDALLQSFDDEPPTAIRAYLPRPTESFTPQPIQPIAPVAVGTFNPDAMPLFSSDDDPSSSLSNPLSGRLNDVDSNGSSGSSSYWDEPVTADLTSLTAAVAIKRKPKNSGRLPVIGIIGACLCGLGVGSYLIGDAKVITQARSKNGEPTARPPLQGVTPQTTTALQPTRAALLPQASPSGATTKAIETLAPQSSMVSAPQPLPTATDIPAIAQPTVQPSLAPIQVSLRAKGRSWMEVIADEKVLYEGIWEKGTHQTWKANQSLVIRVGSAGDVLAAVKDAPAKPMGEPGEVLEFTYTPNGVESLVLK